MINKNTFNIVLIIGLFFSQAACHKSHPKQAIFADLIIHNATIWTGNNNQPFAQSMAVLDDLIVAVGPNAEVKKFKGENTKILNLQGSFVTPGFIDSHVHFVNSGFNLLSIQLRDANTPEEFIKRFKEFANKAEPGTWIIGGSWDHQNWGGQLPNKEWIDLVTPNNPVLVYRLDGHMALANSLALKHAGVVTSTSQVDGGLIEKNDQGELTGIFKDNAIALIIKAMTPPTDKQTDKALLAAMNHVVSQGITTVHDMYSPYTKPAYLKAMKRARDNNTLITRVSVYGHLKNWKAIKQEHDKDIGDNNWLKYNKVKGYVDGSLGSHTAVFNEPYTDQPQKKGIYINTKTDIYNWISNADKASLQVAIHAIGDGANHFILDTFERVAKENGDKDRRFRVEHAQHIQADEFTRFAELNVIASMQPYHAIDDGRWAEKAIGSERIKTTYAFKSFFEANTKVVFGSDWPVAPALVLEGIYAAVTRRTIDDKNPNGWIPQQKITVEQALTAYTKNAAYASFDEDTKGTLEIGKLADFVVMDKDLTKINPIKIKETKILQTYVGGQLVYDKLNNN